MRCTGKTRRALALSIGLLSLAEPLAARRWEPVVVDATTESTNLDDIHAAILAKVTVGLEPIAPQAIEAPAEPVAETPAAVAFELPAFTAAPEPTPEPVSDPTPEPSAFEAGSFDASLFEPAC